jgi:orotidine-5'-phosphate decarboxylase
MASHFGDRLCDGVKGKSTPLVVGLDPVYNRLPWAIVSHHDMNDEYDAASAVDAIFDFCTQTMRIVAPMVAAVKMNIAFFEKYFWEGIETYYALISEANELGLEIIGDVKLEDTLAPDAITVNGFAGVEGIEPFAEVADEQGKGIFVWVRSSNPSAVAVQDFAGADGQMMYEKMAELVGQIANKPERIGERGYSNVGMVVGGTAPDVTSSLREKYDKVWFLVPGYGSQGASAADCVRFCKPDGTGALISASRSIIYAYEKPKYKEQFGDDWKRCVEQAVVDAKVDLAKGMQTLI